MFFEIIIKIRFYLSIFYINLEVNSHCPNKTIKSSYFTLFFSILQTEMQLKKSVLTDSHHLYSKYF